MGRFRCRSKAVSEIISMVMITLIGIALASTAFMWGMPLISKQQDKSKIDRSFNAFNQDNTNSILKKIEFVANNGGQETFNIDVDGLWTVHPWDEHSPANNSLDFLTFTKVTNIAVNTSATQVGWVALTTGGSCPPKHGIVGIDPRYVVCAVANPYQDGYNVKYRVWFRVLDENTGARSYLINATKHPNGPISGSGNAIKIFQGYPVICPAQQCGSMMIMTEIKFMLS
jgi:hypothetical protein